jgi:hypothetical protein
MSGDHNDSTSKSVPQPSQNPGAEIPTDPTAGPQADYSVSGDEAEDAARRAASGEPVTRSEVVEQSAYKDDAADMGQQAASSEREESDRKAGRRGDDSR